MSKVIPNAEEEVLQENERIVWDELVLYEFDGVDLREVSITLSCCSKLPKQLGTCCFSHKTFFRSNFVWKVRVSILQDFAIKHSGWVFTCGI